MKHVVKYLIIIAATMTIACGGPRRVIPDSKLEQIVREMFITNAYVSTQGLRADSLDLYDPIFARYGYTKEDFFYTLGEFQKRKSARFSYIINNTIEALEAEADNYEYKVRNLNYIDSLAVAALTREVYFDQEVVVRRFRDTSKLWIRIPVREGSYEVSYSYEIDSLDRNNRLQSTFILQRQKGGRSYYHRSSLLPKGRQQTTNTVNAAAINDTLAIQLADYTRREDRPAIRFDSIRIVYRPPLREALAHMASLLMFYPEMVYSDSIRQYVLTGVKPPLSK